MLCKEKKKTQLCRLTDKELFLKMAQICFSAKQISIGLVGLNEMHCGLNI